MKFLLKKIAERPKTFNLLIFPFYFVLVTCPLVGQVKQTLSPLADYKLWGSLHLDKVSVDGRWVSFDMTYSKTDTLFLQDTKHSKLYAFPKSANSSLNSMFFACSDTSSTLLIIRLKDMQKRNYPNTLQYVLSRSLQNLVLLREHNNRKRLDIINKAGKVIKTFTNVESFASNDQNTKIICRLKINNLNHLMLLNIDVEKLESSSILVTGNNVSDFTWDKQGLSFCFLENFERACNKDCRQKINYYSSKTQDLSTFDLSERVKDGKDYKIHLSAYKLKISDDAERVFFCVSENDRVEDKEKNAETEIWNGNDYWLYPRRKSFEKTFASSFFLVWHPLKNVWQKVTSDAIPICYLNGNQKQAIGFNPINKTAEFNSEADHDLYRIALDKRHITKITENISGDINNSIVSPDGKYLAYFKEGNWQLYNFQTQISLNITGKISTKFYSEDSQRKRTPYGIAGWSDNDSEILIYDQFDIWKITISSSKAERLTKGREQKICFRTAIGLPKMSYIPNYFGQTGFKIDGNNLVLKAESSNHNESGFFLFKRNRISKIVFEEGKISDIIRLGTTNKYLYLKQKYNHPPALITVDAEQKRQTELYQSNRHYKNYGHGKSELISYKNSKGKELKAALFYPADYSSEKNYPMIVYTYQNKSHQLHEYNNPNLYDPLGFCNSNYTSQGYFVLYPDISYEEGKPGDSATDCVASAVQEIVSKNLVDPKRIGIIGHSFGAYEVNIIIAKSGLFAAAVSGAGISDLTSFYFSVGAFKKAEIWRLENDQWGMGKSLYESMDNYNANSPVICAQNINTPLLIWTGKEDKVVSWNQSIEMYLALKRLHKKTIMLVYPSEQHFLLMKEKQADLNIKIQNWFDYFLKDKNTAEWISSGI